MPAEILDPKTVLVGGTRKSGRKTRRLARTRRNTKRKADFK